MAGDENEEQFRENIQLQKELNIETDLLEPTEITRYGSGIRTEDVSVAAIEHNAGYADPYLVATGFADKARELGTEIRTNEPVTDLVVENGTVRRIETASDAVPVDFVVNAGGPSADDISKMAGVELPLSRYEVKLVVLSGPESFEHQPVISDIDNGLYVKPEPNGNFVAGGIQRGGGHEPLAGRKLEGITNEDLLILDELLERRLPGYTNTEVVESWSGIITASPDWYQIIGIPSELENLYNIAAGSGHGFKESPGFAESIAKDILDEPLDRDLSPYRLDRFERGETLNPGYKDGSRG